MVKNTATRETKMRIGPGEIGETAQPRLAGDTNLIVQKIGEIVRLALLLLLPLQ